MSHKDLDLGQVSDEVLRRVFEKVQTVLNEDVFGHFEGKHLEITVSGAVTNYRWPHNLGFLPKDIVQTSLIGAGSLTWNYVSFDATYVNLTTTGACTVRALVGSFVES
jgi:hypothetical protein